MKAEEAKDTKSAEAKPKKKINQLTLNEVNKRIENIKEQMGGINSDFAKRLLKRKELLEK